MSQPASRPQVTPYPLPMETSVEVAVNSAGPDLVLLQLVTPQGISCFYFPPDSAFALAVDLRRYARAAKSGLVVLPAGLVKP